MYSGIKNALLNSAFSPIVGGNKPCTSDTLPQYFADDTRDFMLSQMQWATDNVRAEIQGLTEQDFYVFHRVTIRTANVIHPTTGRIMNDDWQRIYVLDKRFTYIPRGAKVVFNGNVYLVVNPKNAQSIAGTAIVRRCNATWCHLSPTNCILKEPFIYGDGEWDNATGNWSRDNMMNMDGYQHAIMQKNPDTQHLQQNERFLLGSQSYTVRGVVDFIQDISTDENSTHIIYFDMDKAEPLHANDDEINHIANGKGIIPVMNVPVPKPKAGLAWVVEPPENMKAYTDYTLKAGVYVDSEVTDSPVEYFFAGADTKLYTVYLTDGGAVLHSFGQSAIPLIVTAVAGEQTITARINLVGW